MTVPTPRGGPVDLFAVPHEHTNSCYWDLDECRWHCARTPARPAAEPSSPEAPHARTGKP